MLSILTFAVAMVSMVQAEGDRVPEVGVGGFMDSCINISLVYENHHIALRAECQASGNTTQCSILGLNPCFVYQTQTNHIEWVDK